jgi:branched-chain amino acid transport system ATP-binding protein
MTNSPLLDVDDIYVGYGDDSEVLHGVSLDVEPGEVVAILGRNGAGKTTTMRSIIGMQRPSNGRISFHGDDITDEAMYETARRGIGFVPEDRRIFGPLTVKEHLSMGVETDYRSAKEEFKRAYERFPKLETLRDRQARNLSGGEQQMLAIARALVGRSELLLLDEPTEGLAPKIVSTVADTIAELKTDHTILLVEQNYPLAQAVADRYYILDNGLVKSKGSIPELEANEELKDKYLGIN